MKRGGPFDVALILVASLLAFVGFGLLIIASPSGCIRVSLHHPAHTLQRIFNP